VHGYTAPADQTVTVTRDNVTNVPGAYVPIPSGMGSLSVNTTPVKGEVFVDQISWGTSPITEIVSTGDHTVRYADVTGYLAPDDQVVTVARNQVAMAKGTYTKVPPGTGVLSIDTAPPKAEVLVDGQSWGTAPEQKIVPVGTYTIRFMDVAGFITPDNQTVTITENATTRAVGTYTRLIPPTYMLTVEIDGQGQVEPTTGVPPQNAKVTLLAAGDAVWHFDHWEGSLTGTANPQTLTMDGDKTVKAVFVKNPLIMPCSEYFGLPIVLMVGACMLLLGARLRS